MPTVKIKVWTAMLETGKRRGANVQTSPPAIKDGHHVRHGMPPVLEPHRKAYRQPVVPTEGQMKVYHLGKLWASQ